MPASSLERLGRVHRQAEIVRCQREIAAAEAALLAGHPDVAGLCLALSDWSAELRILQAGHAEHRHVLQAEQRSANEKSRRPEGRRLEADADLFPEPVDPVPGFGLRTLDLETHLLAQGSAQEAPDTVRLPARGLHELGKRHALFPPEQGQYVGFLAALAGSFGFLLWPFGLGLAAFAGIPRPGRPVP